MLGIYSEDAELTQRLRRRLPDPRAAGVVAGWEEYPRLFGRVECGIVVAPDPEPELFARMQSLKERHPLHPIVLVTRKNPRALRRLKDVVLEEVIWADELDELAAALQRARAERCFREIESRLRRCSHLSPTLVAALARAVRRRPPLTSVGTLAAEVDRDRRTLWHHWRDAIRERSDLTPKGFLDWILLLRAASGKTDGTPWRRVARDLGVHTRTIRRVADRRLQASLDRLTTGDREAFFRAFDEEVMHPLAASGER